MISEQNIASLIGANVTDTEGNKIGKVGQIYVDPTTGRPNWATVVTGLFGTSESFVPLDQADAVDGELRVPHTKDVVKDAPRIDSGTDLTDAEQNELYTYYGHGGAPATVPADGNFLTLVDIGAESVIRIDGDGCVRGVLVVDGCAGFPGLV